MHLTSCPVQKHLFKFCNTCPEIKIVVFLLLLDQVAIIFHTSIDLETLSSGTKPSALGERRTWRPLLCTCCEINIMVLTALKRWQVEKWQKIVFARSAPLFSQIRSQDNRVSVCVSVMGECIWPAPQLPSPPLQVRTFSLAAAHCSPQLQHQGDWRVGSTTFKHEPPPPPGQPHTNNSPWFCCQL